MEKTRKNTKAAANEERNPRESSPPVAEANSDDVPLEKYRIIDDEGGLITDYLIAVFSLVEQWIRRRHDLQEI
jgi:hypothetical protein